MSTVLPFARYRFYLDACRDRGICHHELELKEEITKTLARSNNCRHRVDVYLGGRQAAQRLGDAHVHEATDRSQSTAALRKGRRLISCDLPKGNPPVGLVRRRADDGRNGRARGSALSHLRQGYARN